MGAGQVGLRVALPLAGTGARRSHAVLVALTLAVGLWNSGEAKRAPLAVLREE